MDNITTDEFLWCAWLATELLVAVIVLFNIGAKRPNGTLFIAPALVAGIVGLAQLGVGIAQKAKAAKMARQNKRPELGDNPYTEEAYELTASRAQAGLSSSAMQGYNTNNDRGLAASINAVMRSGGSVNNIADLYEGSQSGLRGLALANDEARSRNVNTFLTAGLQSKADQNRDQWFLNRYTPFQDQAQAATQLSQQGSTNTWKGINTMGNAAMNYAQQTQSGTQGQNGVDRTNYPQSTSVRTPYADVDTDRMLAGGNMNPYARNSLFFNTNP